MNDLAVIISDLSFQLLSMIIVINIPLLFVAVLLGNTDSRRIVIYFCWGVFAGGLAFLINSLLNYDYEQSQRMNYLIAPIVEEVCKALPLLLFLNEKKYPRVTKLIISCAMVSGVGFSVQESIYYFSESSRTFEDVTTLVIRSLTTALMHGMTTAFVGVGLLLLHKQKHIIVPLIFSLLALSVSLHALFNLLLETRLLFIGLLMPLAMFFTGFVFVRNYYVADMDIDFIE